MVKLYWFDPSSESIVYAKFMENHVDIRERFLEWLNSSDSDELLLERK